MKVAINGTGVAGPTLAYWLRLHGHEPVLFEKAPALRTGGYLIDFWGPGYEIAEKMGIGPDLRARGYRMNRLVVQGDGGETRADMDMSAMRDLLGDRLVSIPRGDIASLLFEACRGVETRFGVSVQALEQGPDGVKVTLTDGSVESFDLVVGADGLHSHVRDLAFVPESRCARDLGCAVAAFRLEGYPAREELTFLMHNAPAREIGRISLRGDRTLVLMIFRAPPADPPPASTDEVKALLRKTYGGMKWEVSDILDRMDGVDEIYYDRVCQIHLDDWTNGRVALIGDAAACASLLAGEGTGLAMTEAYVLAGELHRSGGDHVAAFRAYGDRLRTFIRGKQKDAPRNLFFFTPRSRIGIWFRDRLFALGNLRFFAKRFVAGVMSDDFSLPDYGGDGGPPPARP